jgi:hypothetical protein
MPLKKIGILDEILSDDFIELVGLKNVIRSKYAKKNKALKNAFEKCYIDEKTYIEIKNKLDNNLEKNGLKADLRTPDDQRINLNRAFFKHLDAIAEFQQEGLSNNQIYTRLCEKYSVFQTFNRNFVVKALEQATDNPNKTMSGKYEKYSDEVRALLSDGNTAYFIANFLLQKYPDENLAFFSIWKYAKEMEAEMNEDIGLLQ